MADVRTDRERLAILEERLRGIASSSSVLHENAGKGVASVQAMIVELQKSLTDVDKHLSDFASEKEVRELKDRIIRLEERLDGVRQDVTGRHKVSIATPSDPPRRETSRWDIRRSLVTIIVSLVALLATLVHFLVSFLIEHNH